MTSSTDHNGERARKFNHVRPYRVLAALPAVAILGVLAGCNAGWATPQEPSQPPTVAAVQVSTSFSSSGAPTCSDTTGTTWQAIPLAVPAGPGKSSPIADAVPPSGNFPPNSGRCYLSHLFTGLQPGKWRIAVIAGSASGACDTDIKAGHTRVEFVDGACSVTP